MKRQGLTEELLNETIADYEHSEILSERDRAVLRFVDLLYERPHEVRLAEYDRLRQVLSDDEIVELHMFLVFNLGLHTVISTLDVYPMLDPSGNLISQAEARTIYGDSPKPLTTPLPPLDTA